MIIIDNFDQVTAQIESERGVTREQLVSAIEQALVSACRKKFPEESILEAELNQITGEAKIYLVKTVVSKVEDEDLEISLKEAKKIDPDASKDSEIRIPVTPPDFGRIAALTAKQVIIQRIREAEKEAVFEEFTERIGEVITGTIQRVENQNYLVNLGRTEAILTPRDQIPGETFQAKDKIRVYLADIEKTARRTNIHISRTHPGLLKRLFELEIPEIQDGIIDIMSVSREPGKRSKVAVKSNNPAIGAVGTCVGHMGGRIQSIIKELGFEKIDVLEWNESPKIFIANALKPAKISHVLITNEEEKTAAVVVPNDQLSLAIGKSGINVRLSVKLTGWKLDIMSEDEFAKNAPEGSGGSDLSIVEKIKLEKERLENPDADSASNTPSTLLANLSRGGDSDGPNDEPETLTLSEKLARAAKEALTEESEDDLMKVSDLAKQLDMKTQDLIDAAAKFGLKIKNNRAKLSAEDVNTIKENL